MASNDIKQRIVLEGEQQYKQALKDAQRNLKTLRSELKAETAELGKNATEQEKNAAKVKNLQKQIAEQEKVVKTYKEALAEVREKYADNEDAIAKWEQKLNDARTSLANMKNELDGVGDGFKGIDTSAAAATVAAKSVADTIGNLANIGSTIADGIEGAFTGVVDKVRAVIGEVWGEIVDLAARSNNLVDLAGYWNTDVTTIQKYAGAVQSVSGTLEDLSGIVTKINSKDAKKVAELTGVSSVNYEDQWEYAMAVMDAMSKLDTKARNAAGFELFGKGATKAFDILNDWQKLQENLDKYDATKGGYGLTEEELQQMSDLYDKVNGLKASWQSLKDMATVKLFGQLSMDLTSNAQAILDGFLKYFNAGSDQEREAALAEIEANILAMFETAKAAIEKGVEMLAEIAEDLKSSDNPTAQALGNILGGLVEALKWITDDHMNNVVTALGILAAFWAGTKALTMIANIASFASHISTLVAAKGIGSAAAGAAAGTSWGTAFASAVMKAAPWLIGLYTLLNPSGTSDETGDNTLIDESGNLTKEAVEAGFTKDENGDLLLPGNDRKMDAVQQFWDKYRNRELTQKDIEELGTVILNDQVMSDLMQAIYDFTNKESGWQNTEDLPDWVLPASWWQNQGGNTGSTEGMTSGDAKNMVDAMNKTPTAVGKAVANGMSGVKVYMDGRTVGNLVAPYVSEYIASSMIG